MPPPVPSKRLCAEEIEQRVMVLLSEEGGLSHLQLTSNDWHQKHDNAAKDYFGFESWKELKLYVSTFFFERYLPYFNRIRTLRVLHPRDVKQFEVIELLDKRDLCTGQYVSETAFS